MRHINLEKIAMILTFVLIGTMFLIMGYQVVTDCYNAFAR